MLVLDRMTIEEAGPNPEDLAAAIYAQLRHEFGAVPIEAIAEALDIVEIRHRPLMNFEGALVMPPDRNVGSIAVNSASSPQRRRYTVAHELCHFLNVWHRPQLQTGGFSCSRADLRTPWRKPSASASRHYRQEAEADRFAIEVLAPPDLVLPYLAGSPDLAKILELARRLYLSREASARRYVELHQQPTALVFSVDGIVRYFDRHPDFPFIGCQPGQPLPILPQPEGEASLSAHVGADWRDWLASPEPGSLVLQTLNQQKGHAMTLLGFAATVS